MTYYSLNFVQQTFFLTETSYTFNECLNSFGFPKCFKYSYVTDPKNNVLGNNEQFHVRCKVCFRLVSVNFF